MLDLALRKKLRELVAGEVLFDAPLSQYTSFGTGGPADAIVFPGTAEQISNTLVFLAQEGRSFLPLGNGTNLIVRDGGYRGVLVCLKRLNHLDVVEDDGGITLKAEAGVTLADVIGRSFKDGLGGMEFCAGVPGSIGGAVKMNAGAYGREIKDVVTGVTFVTLRGEMVRQKRRELHFSYRQLAVPLDRIILAAGFSLVRKSREEVRARVEEILARRREKHPLDYRNAGSIFKNPEELPAGRLIEEMGLKGLRIGEAKISERHGNFIVNLGGAKAADVLSLITLIKDKARQERGIVLETEVCIIGEET